jgi:hypothetical protein
METYDAFLAAADHIESHPERFEFLCSLTPMGLNVCGCAIGWVGYFSERFRATEFAPGYGAPVEAVASVLFGIGYNDKMDEIEFYVRMEKLCGSNAWKTNARLCAKTLRAYAALYHAHQREPLPAIPAAVRAIFETFAPVEAA